MIEQHPFLRMGSYSNAMEEYAEAVIFQVYLTENRLMSSAEVRLVHASLHGAYQSWAAVLSSHMGPLLRKVLRC